MASGRAADPPGRREQHAAGTYPDRRGRRPLQCRMHSGSNSKAKDIASNNFAKGTILLHKNRSLFLLGNSCIEQGFCPLCGGFWCGMMQIQQAERTNPLQSNPHHERREFIHATENQVGTQGTPGADDQAENEKVPGVLYYVHAIKVRIGVHPHQQHPW